MLKTLQSRGNGVERGRNNQFPASLKSLTPEQAIKGSLLYLGKTAPTPALKRNIFLDVEKGNIKVPEYLKPTIEEFRALLALNSEEDTQMDADEISDQEEF